MKTVPNKCPATLLGTSQDRPYSIHDIDHQWDEVFIIDV